MLIAAVGGRQRGRLRGVAVGLLVVGSLVVGVGSDPIAAQETTFGATGPAPAEGAEAAEAAAGRQQQVEDWVVRCGKPAADAAEICEMVQQQLDPDQRPVMAVAVGKLPDNPNPGMLIVLPLGIVLPPGVEVSVDGGPEVPVPVQRCERRGCEVELLLEPDLLARFKAGRQAQVAFQVVDPGGQRKGVGVPISLLGFTAALNEVMK